MKSDSWRRQFNRGTLVRYSSICASDEPKKSLTLPIAPVEIVRDGFNVARVRDSLEDNICLVRGVPATNVELSSHARTIIESTRRAVTIVGATFDEASLMSEAE